MARPAPPLTARTEAFWRSGEDGRLRIATCQSCGWRLHPPRPACPNCHNREISFEPVSGQGVIHSFTINRYQLSPNMQPPYILAEVALIEQKSLILLTNIVNCAVQDMRIGMPVSVTFESVDDAWIPVFQP